MAYPIYTKEDLASYTGRDLTEYSGFSDTAIQQATLLFKIATCLADLPDDPIQVELAQYAILSIADAIVLAQPFQKVIANPFSSESIGSYSYSKASKAVAAGLPTGISWFDLAVGQMSVCEISDGMPTGGGIEVFEHDGSFTEGFGENVRLLTTQDYLQHNSFLQDTSKGYLI